MRALLSVTDKTGIVEFAKDLLFNLNCEIISTGGTARVLKADGLPVTEVADVTGMPECIDGRLKTLHHKVLGGILARDTSEDRQALNLLEAGLIDIVVVNLYQFAKAIERPDITTAEAIEQIDIGGPTMIRAAAKNFERVTVVVDPDDYEPLSRMLREDGEISFATRKALMVKAFGVTAGYDAAINAYFKTEWIRQALNKNR